MRLLEKSDKPIYITSPILPDINLVIEKLEQLWKTKYLTNNGEFHHQLVEDLKKYLKTDQLTLFNSGTISLLLGLKALDLKGEVITTPFTFPATVEVLEWLGIKTVFCDVNPIDYTIDVNKIESLINSNTCAILGVHVFGNICDVDNISRIADKYKLKVIYDGAHAFGSKINGKPIWEYGDLTMLSFHATKFFHTVEGGALIYKDASLSHKLDLLKNFGIENPDSVVLAGLNGKMSELHAVMGIEVLKILDCERVKRLSILKQYKKRLANVPGIRLINDDESDHNSLQYFPIAVDLEVYGMSRDELFNNLKEVNIFARKYFYPLCSNLKWYRENESAQVQNLPVANEISEKVLVLPFYGELTKNELDIICNCIIKSNIGGLK